MKNVLRLAAVAAVAATALIAPSAHARCVEPGADTPVLTLHEPRPVTISAPAGATVNVFECVDALLDPPIG
jgi:hypothetical protein